MGEGWKFARVGDLATMVKRGKAPAYSDTGLLVLSQKCVRDGHVDPSFGRRTDVRSRPVPEWALLRSGDCLVNSTGTGTLGRVGYLSAVPGPATVDGHVTIVRPDSKKVVPAYLGIVLQWQQRDLIALQSGSTNQTELAPSALSAVEVSLPPLAEQRRIVDLVSSIDSRTTESRRLREAAEAARSAVFEQFAEGMGNGPTVTLGAIAEVVSGVTKDEKRQVGDRLTEVPYLRVANVQRGYLDLGEMTTIKVEPARAERLRLKAGDVLFNEGGDRDKLGRGWVWEDQVADCIHQNHVLRARLNTVDFDPWFVSIWGNSHFGREWFELNGSQTTNLASLNLSTLRVFPIPAIPPADQRRVVDLWMGFDSVSKLAGDVESATTALRASLLADLLSGDHQIPETYDRFLDGAA